MKALFFSLAVSLDDLLRTLRSPQPHANSSAAIEPRSQLHQLTDSASGGIPHQVIDRVRTRAELRELISSLQTISSKHATSRYLLARPRPSHFEIACRRTGSRSPTQNASEYGGHRLPPTFFDKGFAEHFQPRVRDAITDVHLRKLIGGERRNRLRVALAEH